MTQPSTNEELKDLYRSPNIQVIKSRRMRWEGACSMYGERRGSYRVLVGNRRERDHFKGPGLDGRIILRLIFKKWNGGMDWVDLVQDRDRWRALVKA
jgi:hypothetical protein